jgi:hypothetical protein
MKFYLKLFLGIQIQIRLGSLLKGKKKPVRGKRKYINDKGTLNNKSIIRKSYNNSENFR